MADTSGYCQRTPQHTATMLLQRAAQQLLKLVMATCSSLPTHSNFSLRYKGPTDDVWPGNQSPSIRVLFRHSIQCMPCAKSTNTRLLSEWLQLTKRQALLHHATRLRTVQQTAYVHRCYCTGRVFLDLCGFLFPLPH
eukprot:scpid32481/ scgid17913/ 